MENLAPRGNIGASITELEPQMSNETEATPDILTAAMKMAGDKHKNANGVMIYDPALRTTFVPGRSQGGRLMFRAARQDELDRGAALALRACGLPVTPLNLLYTQRMARAISKGTIETSRLILDEGA